MLKMKGQSTRFQNREVSFLSNLYNFYPVEVVDRGSEPQLQVGENLSKMTLRVNG